MCLRSTWEAMHFFWSNVCIKTLGPFFPFHILKKQKQAIVAQSYLSLFNILVQFYMLCFLVKPFSIIILCLVSSLGMWEERLNSISHFREIWRPTRLLSFSSSLFKELLPYCWKYRKNWIYRHIQYEGPPNGFIWKGKQDCYKTDQKRVGRTDSKS